ncbi:unnamed protein product [Durusdinium trenchii]|uniref:Uncharacterized protein n=1 Tax=Durusdinium trenchii TaxID=1381693 RepID=A0ABP0R788_9DINO
MACLRFFMMLLLGAAAEHSMDESLVDTLRRGFESLELPKLFGLGPLAGYLQLVISTAAPDLCALLVAGAVFYFLGSAMQVARREMKPAEEVEDEMGDWSQAPEISGCSPLHLAAHNGRLEHLEELLSSGAAVNATDNYNETPLHMAARGGYVDICDVLLHYGADPRVLNKNQKTPLLLAALSGHADVCDLLSPLKLARRPPSQGPHHSREGFLQRLHGRQHSTRLRGGGLQLRVQRLALGGFEVLPGGSSRRTGQGDSR